jgi:hypothetical protein
LELGQTLLRYQAPLQERAPDSASPPEAPAAPPVEPACEAPAVDTGTAGGAAVRPRRGLEGWLVALGVGIALAGLAFTWALAAGPG